MSKNIHQEHVLTLQIGHETNSILSYLWATRELDLVDEEGRVVFASNYHNLNEKDQLVPKVVMIDNQYNDLDPNEGIVDIHKLQKNIPWEGPRTTVNRSTATRPFAKATHKPYYSKTKFHPKSFVTFDAVDEKENSHWYYQRNANNGIRESTEDSEEVASDAIRYFAEASDRVDAIDVFADIYGDLGYTTSRIVEQLRDDYSKSVSIPIWLLDHCHVYNYHVQQHHRLAPEKTSKLFDSSLALNYANLHESADLLIPLRIPLEESIEDVDARFFHYRLTGAVALEASLAFRQMHRETDANDTSSNNSVNSMATKEWINLTSNGYRLPIVSMEAFIPALTHDVSSNQDYLFHSLNELKLNSQYHLHQFQYNPFMKSFAIPSLLNSNKKYDHDTRPFTNSLAFRGISGPEFVEKLFVECIQSSYLLTKSNCYSYCLPVKWQESAASDVSADDFVAATAIGSNAALGDHIREEAVEWYESALTALPQYAKIDIGKDDLETKRELLLQLSELYL